MRLSREAILEFYLCELVFWVPAVLVVLRRYPGIVKHSVLSTTPTAETPALSDEERLERRRRFIERVFSPDGLDRDTLKHIEQLTDNES
jgi:hypothetical protein